MQFPKIHLNGSHGPTLLQQYLTAAQAVELAIRNVEHIDCHGRDYYTILGNSDAASLAAAEHKARLFYLTTVAKELRAIAENISEQVDAIEANKNNTRAPIKYIQPAEFENG